MSSSFKTIGDFYLLSIVHHIVSYNSAGSRFAIGTFHDIKSLEKKCIHAVADHYKITEDYEDKDSDGCRD